MATAYNAATYNDQQISIGWQFSIYRRPFSFTVPSAGFALNDTVALCPISYRDGILVLDYNIEIPELDSNATPTVKLDLGDNNGASGAFEATFVSAGAIGGGSTGGVLNPLMCFNGVTAVTPVRGLLPKQYTAAMTVNFNSAFNFMLRINTAPATATTSGTIKGYLTLMSLPGSSVTF